MGQNVDVVLDSDLLVVADAEVFLAVLTPQTDDAQHSQNEGQAAHQQLEVGPHFGVVEAVEDLHAVFLDEDVGEVGVLGNQSGNLVRMLRRVEGVLGDQSAGQEDGIPEVEHHDQIHRVEHGEDGTLRGIVGEAGLRRLGDHALAGVADDVQCIEHDVQREPQAHAHAGQHMEHRKGHAEQNGLADDDEGAVFAELGIGLVNDEADERVGDTVPDTHDGTDGAGQNGAQAHDADEVVADGAHQQHVEVGREVVAGIETDLPYFGAVDAFLLVFQRQL